MKKALIVLGIMFAAGFGFSQTVTIPDPIVWTNTITEVNLSQVSNDLDGNYLVRGDVRLSGEEHPDGLGVSVRYDSRVSFRVSVTRAEQIAALVALGVSVTDETYDTVAVTPAQKKAAITNAAFAKALPLMRTVVVQPQE
ncbi:MAG: hypothetical protein ACYSW8_31750 [Planctomycetota bacterium]